MSKYTTEVRYICEVAAGLEESKGYDDVNDIIDSAIPHIFDFDYPIFDDSYKGVLERKILKHYYTREIAFETVGLWKLKLDTRMNEIMPYYNKLYETTVYEFNPLYDVDYYRSGEGNKRDVNSGTDSNVKTYDSVDTKRKEEDKSRHTVGSGVGTSSEQGNSSSGDHTTDLYSDTPQGAIIVTSQTDDAVTMYMTNARKIDENHSKNYGKNGTTGNQYEDSVTEGVDGTETLEKDGTVTDALTHGKIVTGTNDYVEHVWGKQANVPYSKLVAEFRKTLINIDLMIIKDLEDLFFMLF